jgi:hypothetical protein
MALTKVSRGLLNTSIVDNGNATAITIDSSENVGIGTSSPTYALSVKGLGSSSVPASFESSDSSSWLMLKDSGTTLGNVRVGSSSNALVQYAGGAERMRILSTGGITFNGDTAQANALDDYEEGTWTPTVLFSSQSVGVAYTRQVGIYTKIGDLVTLFAEIRLSSKGSSTGAFQIGGLPFTPSLGAVNWVGGTTANFANFSSLNSPPLPSVNNNQAYITMRQLNNSAGLGTNDPLLTNGNVGNSMILGVTVTYKV